MKSNLISAFLLIALALPFSAFAESEELIQLPEKVFTPVGFDNNDRAEIVLHGHFPNTCYRAGAASATIDNGKIFVKNVAYRDTAAECINMSVPWTTTVVLGALPSRSYPIFVESPTGEQVLFERLEIALSASPSIDDFLYAYVNGVMVKVDPVTLAPTVSLSGSFSVTCMYIQEVKILRLKRNVVTVMPIVAFDHTKTCGYPFAPIPFQKTFRLAAPLDSRATLFHVRSLNGQSLNRVVEF